MIYNGDCLEVLAGLPENSVDTCITDPPYGLEFMGKDWDAPWKDGKAGVNFNTSCKGKLGGFKQLPNNSRVNNLKCKICGKWKFSSNPCTCEKPKFPNARLMSMVAFQEWTLQWATEVYRVLKPGAMLLAFGGTRTYHRMVCAIEDAGFEIRDTIAWVYGSGFPKSHDISKAIDKMAGAERKVTERRPHAPNAGAARFGQAECTEYVYSLPSTPSAQLWDGWGTALKPAFEPIVVAMKPIDGNFVNNALTWGVAGYWIDGGRVGFQSEADYQESTQKNRHGDFNSNDGIRVPTKGIYHGDNRPPINYEPTKGRFPANLIHDGSDEVLECFPQTTSGGANGKRQLGPYSDNRTWSVSKTPGAETQNGLPASSGSAARFFYCAKASRSERNAGLEGMEEVERVRQGLAGEHKNTFSQNSHPTVKPIELMRYLVRLTKTPTGGIVLDPFMGSGTTGIACVLEGRDFIGIEREAEYVEIAEKRIAHYRLPMLDINV